MGTKSKVKTVDDIQKVTVTSTECRELIKHQLLQVLRHGPKYHGKLFFIEGEPGIGKTQMQAQILSEVCEEISTWKESDFYDKSAYNYWKDQQKSKGRLEVQNLSARDSGDFSGLPYNQEIEQEIEKEIVKKMMLKFSQPDFMPSQGIGMLFWDEGNRVFDISLQAVLLSMWMDRGVNGHRLGNGYIQVIAGNLFDDPRFKTCKFDDAALGRIAIVRLIPTVAEAIEFLESKYKKDQGHFLIDYLKDQPDLCNLSGNSENGFSPRDIDKAMEYTFTLRKVDEVLENKAKTKLLENSLKIYFGAGRAASIMNFIKNNKEITLARILDNPTLIKKIKAFDMPLQTSVTKEIIKYIFDDNKFKKDIPLKDRETITSLIKVLHAENQGLLIDAMHDEKNNAKEDDLKKFVDWLKGSFLTDPTVFSQVKNAWAEVSKVKQTKKS